MSARAGGAQNAIAARREHRPLARAVRRVVVGEAGPGPALILASVAMVIVLISIGGPRALVSADNVATRQAIAQAPALDDGALVTADIQIGPGAEAPTAAAIGALSGAFAADLPSPRLFAPAGRWAGFTLPTLQVTNAAPSAAADNPPILEVAYRTALARNSVLVAGALPGQEATRPGPPGRPVALAVAVTKAMATRFSLRVGSVVDLTPAQTGGPPIRLRVTGIVRPVDPASSFWQIDPALGTPVREGKLEAPYWLSGVFAGPGDLAAIASAYVGEVERFWWFFPLGADVTAVDVPQIEAGVATMAISPAVRNAEIRLNATALQHTAVSTGLADGLAGFSAQWQGVAGADSLLVVGLFTAGVILLLICSALAAEAYRPELVLIRVRGGSLTQLAGRMLARSCCVAIPGLACGAILAIALLPDGAGGNVWLLGGLTALAAIAGLPVICVLAHRRPQADSASRRRDLVLTRPSVRRLVGELMVLVVAVAAVADVRLRGAGSGSTAPYLAASAVLVAVAIWLIVNRAYRAPLRALAAAASGRRGPAGFVGLSRAARSPAGSALPALALIMTVTLAAFSVMVAASVSAGQRAASWAQVGADAVVFVPGTASVTSADLRALSKVAGVRHAASVYTAQSQGSLSVVLASSGSVGPPTGLAVVDPRSYAALSADTPWPGFPAAALARRGVAPTTGPAARVPVLVTPDLAARAGPGAQLQFAGSTLPVRIVGTITDTAAMPAGGSYLVLPQWAAPLLPSIPAPSTVLLTGSGINVPALRGTAARVLPGSQVTIRRQVLSALAASPALHLSESLYLAGGLAAAVLSVLALLFALAASARSRDAMMTRLAALGMASRQALLLRLTDAVPLLSVAAIGSVAASWLLAEVIGPVLGLAVFGGSTVPVPLRPTWPALVVPLAGVAVLVTVFLAIDGLLSGRRDIGAALRQEEAG